MPLLPSMACRYETLPSASEAGPAPKRIVVAYGFWIFLLSDIVMFSALFASLRSRSSECNRGRTGRRRLVQSGQRCASKLLASSPRATPVGCMSLAVNSRAPTRATYFFAAATFALGAVFLALELREFADMIAQGRHATTQRFFVRLLHACRMPRAPRCRRTDLAGGDDGPGRGQGLSRHA